MLSTSSKCLLLTGETRPGVEADSDEDGIPPAKDQLAVITMGGKANVVVPPTSQRTALWRLRDGQPLGGDAALVPTLKTALVSICQPSGMPTLLVGLPMRFGRAMFDRSACLI